MDDQKYTFFATTTPFTVATGETLQTQVFNGNGIHPQPTSFDNTNTIIKNRDQEWLDAVSPHLDNPTIFSLREKFNLPLPPRPKPPLEEFAQQESAWLSQYWKEVKPDEYDGDSYSTSFYYVKFGESGGRKYDDKYTHQVADIDAFEVWRKARAFTEKHLEKVIEVKQEIDAMTQIVGEFTPISQRIIDNYLIPALLKLREGMVLTSEDREYLE